MTDQSSEIKTAVINLKNSEYEGASFFFGEVTTLVPEDEYKEGDDFPVTFTFNMVENPNDIDIDSVDFHNHLGEILVDIILNNTDDDIDDRKDNTEPSA